MTIGRWGAVNRSLGDGLAVDCELSIKVVNDHVSCVTIILSALGEK